MQPQYTPSTIRSADSSTGNIVRGLFRGLLPLVFVAGVVALVLLLEILVGHATASQDFFTQQRAAVIVLIGGMLAVIATYIISCRVALRQVARLRREGTSGAARGVLIGLAITALVVLLPVLLAVFLPQHPAP